jgi:hypothetical protein
MKSPQKALLLTVSTLLAGGASSQVWADLTIADNGKSNFTIIVPAKAPPSVIQAARELQRTIGQATDAQISIQDETRPISSPYISLGATAQAGKANITAEKIPDSGFRILTRQGNLYIIGLDTAGKPEILWRDSYGKMTPDHSVVGPQYTKDGGWSNGTANGVYTFLEDYLDVRWLMPGELGDDIPRRGKFIIPNIDRTQAPEFLYRELYSLQRYNATYPAVGEWHNRQKLGFSYRVHYDHAWDKVVPRENFKTNPEWYAMINGKRTLPDAYGWMKLETTNPELVQHYANKAIAELKANPHLNSFSLSPTDGRNWSDSPESKALYDPSPTDLYNPEAGAGTPSTTPLMLKWYRDVAAIVARELPGAKLGGYIYGDYLYPPKDGDMKLPDNFVPVIAPSFDYGYRLYRAEVRGQFEHVMGSWAKIAPPVWLYYDLPNQIIGRNASGLITPPATGILNFIFPRLRQYKIKGTIFYANPSWSASAMTNYIQARLLWNPALDANDLQQEWLHRAYGARAGMKMEIYYKNLDEWFSTYYNKFPQHSIHANENIFKFLYAPHYPRLEELFLQAKAEPMTQQQKNRFQLLENNMVVMQWRLRKAGYLPKDFVSKFQRDDQFITDLLFDGNSWRLSKDGAFDMFPVLWHLNQPPRTAVKVNASLTVPEKASSSIPNGGYILLHSTKNQDVVISVPKVYSGSAFVGARIYELAAGKEFELLKQSLFYEGNNLAFRARGNTTYLLRISPHDFLYPVLNYTIHVHNATLATAKFQDNTVYLKGASSDLYVYPAADLALLASIENSGVTLSTQTPAGVALTAVMQQYTNSKLVMRLDEDWLMQIDPDKDLHTKGVTEAGFDDTSWAKVSALDVWQNQGFPDYKGRVWYRKKFHLDSIKKDQLYRIHFGASDGDTLVYINGKKVGEHLLRDGGVGWDKPFTRLVTSALKEGENTIAVQVTKTFLAGGLYKGVALLETEQ